jgi:hypothetical protein
MTENKQKYNIPEKDKRIVSLLVRTFENSFDRYSHMENQAMRHTLFLDKFCVAFDLLSAGLDEVSEDLDAETRERAKKVAESVRTELKDLFNWIQNPHHPVPVEAGQG